jgi:hypothetical protein
MEFGADDPDEWATSEIQEHRAAGPVPCPAPGCGDGRERLGESGHFCSRSRRKDSCAVGNPANDGWIGNAAADEVRHVWGDGIQPISTNLVSPRLSPQTREFLTTVGLPIDSVFGLGCRFFHDERLSVPVSRMSDEHFPVCQVDEFPFAISPESDHVCEVVFDDIRFVNSNIGLFVFFLGRFEKELSRLHGLPKMEQEIFETEVDGAMDAIRGQLEERDPTALYESGFWDSMLWDTIEQAAG